MAFFLAGLGCVATALLPYPGLPFLFLSSIGFFLIGLILSGFAWRRGVQPRSLCVTATVLCALGLLGMLGFAAFAFFLVNAVHIS